MKLKVCDHRTVICPKCDEKVGLSKPVDHLSNLLCCYDSAPIPVQGSSVKKEGFTFEEGGGHPDWKVSLYSYKSISFAMIMEKYGEYFSFSFVIFASEAISSKYRIEVTVHSPESDSQDAKVSYRFCGAPCSIDEDKRKLRTLGLMVNGAGMERFMITNYSSNDPNFCVSFCIRD